MIIEDLIRTSWAAVSSSSEAASGNEHVIGTAIVMLMTPPTETRHTSPPKYNATQFITSIVITTKKMRIPIVL